MIEQVKPKIIGHRGSAGTHPENTMAAFEEALRVGADGIELDVQLSKDGVPVVIHDETVDRTTNGSGWVKDLTLAELRSLDAGSWFSALFANERIPTLKEVLEWSLSHAMLINIELKTGLIPYPQLEETVVSQIQQYGLQQRVSISSFNHYSLVKTKRLAPDLETAILFMEGLYEPWEYAKTVGASALHCYLSVAMHETFLVGAKKAGIPVRPFTVNEPIHLIQLLNFGCDAVITDWPEKALQLRDCGGTEV